MLKKPETKNSLKTLKLRNRNLVLAFMRNAEAVSVNEISRATGLSKMTVHKIIDYYLEEGMISHAGKGVSTEEGGKKPNLFSFNAHSRYIYSIRIDGNSLATSIVNLKGEIVVGKKTVMLDNVTFEQTIRLVADAFNEQVFENGLACANCLAAVVSCNGLVDVENGVCLASYQYPKWGKNLPVRDSLKKFLPDNIAVHVDSWWRHLAHGEVHNKSDTGTRNRFFLIGNSADCISGGLVHNGVVSSGATGFAGEIGHLIVAPGSDAVCGCGGVGCLEAMVAPSRILERAAHMRKEYPQSLLFVGEANRRDAGGGIVHCGTLMREGGLAALGRAADKGDIAARLVMDGAVEHFAVAINNITQICDPGTVVLFGDFAQMGTYFLESLRDRNHCLCLHGIDTHTKIEYAELTDGCGLVGVATHMTDTLFTPNR